MKKIPADEINVGDVDMETYNKSESYAHIFKCRKCRLEFSVFSWKENWGEEFKPYCPECGIQDCSYLKKHSINKHIHEIVYSSKLGLE
jgi:hypothetical protein